MNRTRTSKNAKRLLVWLLLLTMVFGLLPMAAFADETVVESVVSEEPVQETEPSSEPTEAPSEPSEEPTQEPEEDPMDEPTDEMLINEYAAEDEIAFDYIEKIKDVPLKDNGDMGYRIVHIDCGRKYFTVSELRDIIDYAYKYGYTHVELAFGNDGLRFLLDDMSLTVGETTYESSAVKTAIQNGNTAYTNASTGELSQSEMDEIIKYAKGKGIGIIPMLDAPGHLQAVIRAMKELGISMVEGTDYCRATKSGTSDNWALITTSAAGSEFVQNLVQKYIGYFEAKGCTMFNIAADECGFQYNGDTGWRGMTDAEYTAYAKFVNSLAARVQNAGMTALAFNDGIYHKGLTSDTAFDTSIAICYWDASTDKYASATDLAGKKFKIINTNNKWYYVLGSEGTDWFGFQWSQGYMNGTDKDCHGVDGGYDTKIGCMLALWCDNPGANVNWNNVETHINTLSSNNSEYFKQQTIPAKPELTATPADRIAVGETVTLTLSNYEGNVSWSCEPADVLELSSTEGTGITANALKVGTATVTAAMDDGTTQSIDVTVGDFNSTIENITLVVGDSSKPFEQDELYTPVENVELVNDDGTVVASYTLTNTPGTEYKFTAVSSVKANGTYYIRTSTEKGYLTADGSTTDDLSKAAAWTLGKMKGSNAGYYLKNGNNYLRYDNGSDSWTTTASTSYLTTIYVNSGTFYRTREWDWGYYYTYSNPLGVPCTRTVEETDPKTNIVFKGLAVGTTSVIIGNVKYNITVEAEDLSKVSSLPIQLWITNNTIEASGSNAGATSSGWGGDSSLGSARYINIPAATKNEVSSINSEQGMSVVDAFSAAGMNEPLARYEWGGTRFITARDTKPVQNLVFWTGRIHNSSDNNIQSVWGNDYSNSGDAFAYIRYYGKAWQVSADRVKWVDVTGAGSTGSMGNCQQQLAAYYMTRTEITKEITTDVADWGKHKDGTEYDSQVSDNFVLLDFAVAYQGGTRVPTGFPVSGKTLAYHCATNDSSVGQNGSYYYRRLNNFRAVETGDFEVYMVTVTMTSADGGTTLSSSDAQNGYTYDKTTEQIIWAVDEDTRVASGLENYLSISGSDTFSGCKIGGEPNIRGVEVYKKHGALITYYIRAKQTVTDKLTVNYYVDGETKPFYTYDIVVGENTTFDQAFERTENPVGLVHNTVVNSVNETETVYWELERLPQISAQYRYTAYKFVRTDFTGTDYKVVNLYYTFNAEKTFVVDFGLPLVITPGDVNTNLAANGVSLTKVEVSNVSSYARVNTDDNCNVTYTLKEMIGGKDNFGLQYSGTLVTGNNTVQEGQTAKYSITIIPASNVYYEDSFVKFNPGTGAAAVEWSTEGTTTEATQSLSTLDSKDVYGYDEAYNKSTTFSMGSARKVTVNSDMAEKWADGSAWPTATFTFKGTGFDIISLTDNTSGSITVKVYAGEKAEGNPVKSKFVNNYFGYEYKDGEWSPSKTADVNNALYQIPVMKITDLDYGQYTVVVTVFYDDLFNSTGTEKCSFWFDAVRVYNPLGEDTSRYEAAGEGYPQYIKLRDEIAKGAKELESATVGTVLFVDGDKEASVETYKNIGPNNEVYLAKGQSISFKLKSTENIASVQIGAKAPTNIDAAQMVVNTGVPTSIETATDIETATEMYYEITDVAKSGLVTITNTGKGILSLTNIKITYTKQGSTELAELSDDDAAEAVAAVRALFAEPVQPDEPEKTFNPERFDCEWSKNVRKGGRAILTVKASTDVEYILIDGVKYDKYVTRTERIGWGRNAQRVTYREFIYMTTADEVGTFDFEIAAVNNVGVQSAAKIAVLTVKASSPIRDWIGGLFGRWF